jgi:hypothetical protein
MRAQRRLENRPDLARDIILAWAELEAALARLRR